MGLAPGSLSALGALIGSRGDKAGTAFGLTLFGSLVTSLLCAPLTWILFMVEQGAVGSPGFGSTPGDVLGILFVVSFFGAFIAAPLGLFFGVVFGFGVSTVARLREGASRASLDAALAALGSGWVVVGAAAFTVLLDEQRIDPFAMALRDDAFLFLAAGLAALGAGVALVGATRIAARLLVLFRIRRGAVPGWAIVAPGEVEAIDVPRLLPFGGADGVLVRLARAEAGPFRSGDACEAVALVAR